MLNDYLSPLSFPVEPANYAINQWGRRLRLYVPDAFPDLIGIKIALIGVEEDRLQTGCQKAPDAVREHLYQLYNWEPSFKIADLGNIRAGETQKDTYFAVRKVVRILRQNHILPILIGGTHDVTVAQMLAHSDETRLNALIFDEKIDLYPDPDNFTTPSSFLYPMLMQKSNLFHFSLIGYQRPLTDAAMVEALEKLYFECYPLGEVRENIQNIEPLIRPANLISFDMSAVRLTNAPAVTDSSLFGFSGEEACRIARYAGLSDHVSSMGIYQYNPNLDSSQQPTARLVAQMIWHFVEGVYARKYDLPEIDERNFLKYIVNFKDLDHELTFLKSKKSSRWWMKIPMANKLNADNEQQDNYEWLPCAYADYEMACREQIPDRWMRAYLRLSGGANNGGKQKA